MSVRNEQRYLRRALRSIRWQTFRDYEVVVVDDCSTDATPQILADAARHLPIRVVPGPGTGVADAANVGLSHCTTPFVARLDGDDASLPRRLERQVAELQRNPAAVALGTYGIRVNEWGAPLGRLRIGPDSPGAFRRTIDDGGVVYLTHSSTMFRRRAVEQAGGYPHGYEVGEDAVLFNRLARIGEVYALPETLTVFTVRRSSLSAAHLETQAVLSARLEAEAARGEAYPSTDAFLADVAGSGEWEQRRQRIRGDVVRRRFSRSLANGDLGTAVRTARDGGLGRRELSKIAERLLRGR